MRFQCPKCHNMTLKGEGLLSCEGCGKSWVDEDTIGYSQEPEI